MFNFFNLKILTDTEYNQLVNNISDLYIQISNLKNPKKLPYPTEQSQITNTDIINKNKETNFCSGYLKCLDRIYSVPKKEDVINFLLSSNIPKKKFKNEVFDCDNYAMEFWGLINNWDDETVPYSYPLGFAYSDNHAFNILIASDGQIYIIEPQNGNLFSLQQVRDNPSMGMNGIKYFPIIGCIF
jgi:hypothetical protein